MATNDIYFTNSYITSGETPTELIQSIYKHQFIPNMVIEISNDITISNIKQDVIEWIKNNLYGLTETGLAKPYWEEINYSTFKIKRGFYDDLMTYLYYKQHMFNLVDNRVGSIYNTEELYNNIYLKYHQEDIVKAFNFHEGIIVAPPGSGKTVCAIKALCNNLGEEKAIILVNRIELAKQWKERINYFAPDLEVSIAGGGETYNQDVDITIGLVQTLHSRKAQLEQTTFFNHFKYVILDECHAATAQTVNELVGAFNSRHRLGISATPFKSNDPSDALAILGPVVHETKTDYLYENNILSKAEINVVQTEFDFDYHSDIQLKKTDVCPVKGCKKSKKEAHGHKNNYHKLILSLIEDNSRNNLIVKNILDNKDRINLVLSKRHDHFKNIHEKLLEEGFNKYNILYLTGKETKAQREDAIDRLHQESGLIVFSTIADEGLDVPRLDVLHLTYPTKNTGLIKQQVGRVERYRSDKKTPLVFDYCDKKISLLTKQFRDRKYGVYKPGNYTINII